MVIPKKIHWCWLSGDPLPKKLQNCVDSWYKHMPDYEIILWDMERIQVLLDTVPFVQQAVETKNWAFASDYIRWYALYTEGGIYLDSDVIVKKRFDTFLKHRAFTAEFFNKIFNVPNRPSVDYVVEAEMIGAEKGHPLMKKCLDFYKNQNFSKSDGKHVDVGIAPVVLTKAIMAFGYTGKHMPKGFKLLDEGIAVYSEPYLTWTGGKRSFRHTHAIHFSNGSWGGKFVSKKNILFPLRKLHRYLTTHYWLFARLSYLRKSKLNRQNRL